MGLRENLLTKPRESGGSIASNRFDFQKDWGLCHLLDQHEANRDYVFVFEHHEDITVLFLSDTPETVECFQIKTKTPGNWSLTDLLRRKVQKKVKGLSILGKMYQNVRVFGERATSVNFVSNALYTLTFGDGSTCESKDCVCLGDIEPTQLAKIRTQLQDEHSLTEEPLFGSKGHVRVTNLSLQDHATHAKGKIEAFLARTRPGKMYSVSTIYRTLFDEIRRLSNYEWDATDLDVVLKNKALSRSDFQAILDSVPVARNFDEFWNAINAQLISEGLPFTEIMSLRKVCQSHEIDRMDAEKLVLQQIVTAVKAEAPAILVDTSITTLRAKLEQGVTKIVDRTIEGRNFYDSTYLKAIFLMAFYEY